MINVNFISTDVRTIRRVIIEWLKNNLKHGFIPTKKSLSRDRLMT